MSTARQRQQVLRMHTERKAQTKKLVNDAIERLLERTKTITFVAVADEAGVTKATIYRHPDLRARIEHLRVK